MHNILKLNVPHHSVTLCDGYHPHFLPLFCCACGMVGRGDYINPLNAELNPIYHLLALLGSHHILHVSRIRVNMINEQTRHTK